MVQKHRLYFPTTSSSAFRGCSLESTISSPPFTSHYCRTSTISPPFSHATPAPSLNTPPGSPRALAGSANEPIGPIQHLWGDGESQGVRHLQVDDKLDLRVYFHGEFCRLCPFEDLVHQPYGLPARFVQVWTVAGEAALLGPERRRKHTRDGLPG